MLYWYQDYAYGNCFMKACTGTMYLVTVWKSQNLDYVYGNCLIKASTGTMCVVAAR